MRTTTAFFLILLRLAIGCHFLFEGLHKVHSTWLGPTETNRPFNSEGFFREAGGPLGPVARQGVGDPDEDALARLTPLPAGQGRKDYERVPPPVGQEWDDYLKRFSAHFGLDERQADTANGKLEQSKEQLVRRLEGTDADLKGVTIPVAPGAQNAQKSAPARRRVPGQAAGGAGGERQTSGRP